MLVNTSAEIRRAGRAPLAAGLRPFQRRIRRTTAWDSAHTCRRRSSLRRGLCPANFPRYPAQKLFSDPNPTRETTASPPRRQTPRDRGSPPGSGIGSTSVAKADRLRGGGRTTMIAATAKSWRRGGGAPSGPLAGTRACPGVRGDRRRPPRRRQAGGTTPAAAGPAPFRRQS
jgi:hypothetical protein